ncbi:hypothetical protein QOT17_020140 [Balamuthia mandrillaris]
MHYPRDPSPLEIDDYQSQVLTKQEVQDGNVYSGFFFHTRCTFSLNDPATASKVGAPHSPLEWGFEAMDTIIFDSNSTYTEPYTTSFGLIIKMVGATDVLYDPDISIILSPTTDNGDDGIVDGTHSSSEQNAKGEEVLDSDKKAIITSVTVVVPIAILLALVGVVMLRKQRAKWTAITSTAVSEDEAFIVLNADTFQLRFVGQNSTAVYALPRDPSTGEIVEEYWTLFTIYNFAEKRCYEIRTEDNFASFVSTIGVLDNCSEVERYDIPLAGLPIERAWLEQVNEQSVAFHVLNFGDSNAKLTISYEVIREAEQRSFTNDANTTRTIDILPNSVKISYDVINYTSQVLSPQQVEDGDSYYAFYFYTRFDLSHTIAPFVYPFVTPTYSSPLHPLFSEITENKVAANIMVVDDLFRVKVAQGTFSLNNPATASKQVFNSSEWGFETIDNIIFGYNQSSPEPYGTFFGLEIKMVGARDLVYDPDISVLLTPPGEDEEEDGTEEDGTVDASGTNEREEDGLSAEEKAIVISVTVVVPTAILILVVAAVVFRLRVAKRKRRNTQMLDKVTSVQQ